MKYSLLITVLICAGFGVAHWKSCNAIEALHRESSAAAEAIRAEGFDSDDAASGRFIRIGGQDDPRDAIVREAFADLLTLFVEPAGTEENEASDSRGAAMAERLLAFDDSDLDRIAAAYKAAEEADAMVRGNVLCGILNVIGQDDPAASLHMLDNLGETQWAAIRDVDWMLFRRLAAKDPEAALQRVRRIREMHPERDTRGMMDVALAKLAASDPAKALEIATDEPFPDLDSMVERIGRGAASGEGWVAGLTALRARLAANPADPEEGDLANSYLQGVAETLSRADFSEASRWIESAELTDAERSSLIRGLKIDASHVDPGPWMEWMQRNATGDMEWEKSDSLTADWTKQDFNAVGTWLNDQPPGNARDRATQSFARTLAPYEPAAAAEWAETLPDSPERVELMERIRAAWKRKDPEAAAAFAQEHGIPP